MLLGIPEGKLKNWLLRTSHRIFGVVPQSLAVKSGDAAVLVGVAHTTTMERFSRSIGPKGRLVVIEAEESNASRLLKHARENLLARVSIVKKGAWKEKGQHCLLISPRDACHRLELPSVSHHVDLNGYTETRTIEVDTVDNILKDLGVSCPIGYVAITVNGIELQVLEGMEQTLPQVRRMFVIGRGRTNNGVQPLNVIIAQYLEERGFRTQVGPKWRGRHKEWGLVDGDVFAWRP
jgi:FkbM family methyltransferase